MKKYLLVLLLISTTAFAAVITNISNTTPAKEDKTLLIDVSDTTHGSSGTQKTATISQIFQDAGNITIDGTNVGVGSTAPGVRLDVNGTVRATAYSGDGSGLTGIVTTTSGWTDDGTVVRLTTSTDNVGVGTTAATVKLEVNGGFQSTTIATTGSGIGTFTSFDATGFGFDPDNDVDNDVVISSGGNIGVASTSPGAKVDVVGDVRVSTEVYDATGWNGDLTVPTKDAVRDKIETISGGSGDNVSVDSAAVTDPDFVSTGDIDFVNTSNTITADINANAVALTTDTTGNYIADVVGTASEISVSGTGSEGATATLSLDSSVKGWIDSGDLIYMSDTSDEVGIGTTDNTNAKLMISNADAINSFRVDDSAVDTTPFVIDLGGNVGIGTTTSGQKLSVIQSASLNGLSGASFTHNGVTTASVVQMTSSAIMTTGAVLTLSASSTSGSNTGTVLKATQQGGGAAGYVMYLEDESSDASPNVFANSGNVGIGTTTANNYKMEIKGSLLAEDIYSGDGTQGMTGSCGGVSITSLTIKDGLITACTGT